ncbi:MAG: alanyl-tRNA synthetase [archaeon GW2011_AR19]|nr:MAG: alanyl-tRNA synthetase [archaeon GW2011_AR19]
MNRKQLIQKYIEFFKSKNHKEIPNSSLVPKEDPTVLFTTAGMHPLVPYLLGQKHPLGKKLVGVQKCVRTGDIDEVGDETHHTFFEMLGNWSLGDYWKKEAIEYSFEFLTKILKIKKEKLEVSCFKGDKDSPKDVEAEKIWGSLGISKIKFLGKEDNWWGPAGETGPCGPDTEMFVNNVEIWNDVFMEYEKNKNGGYSEAKQKNIDTGMGVERTLAVLNNLNDNYKTEVWKPIIDKIEKLSGKKYKGNEKAMRIIADHVKASVFIIADGIIPSNKEQGYVLRKLIRRAVRYGKELGLKNFTNQVAEIVFEIYNDYQNLKEKKIKTLEELKKEERKFSQTLEKGLNEFNKLTKDKKKLNEKSSFLLYQSYGFPLEMIEEECKKNKINFSKREFEQELKKHQQLSQTASAGRFKSGLADTSEKTTKLHTATHLLNEALRKILGQEVKQRGSNITPERLRFDFTFDRKLTQEEIKKIENLVNKKISESLEVIREEMPLKKAFESGAQGEFGAKYPEKVSVYTIGNFSKEICTGPHIKNTSELGKFKIIKEESSSAGVRRIKAVLE